MLNLRASFLMCLLAAPAVAQPTKPETGGLMACSEGNGTVRLLWSPSPDRIPTGGWRVQDEKGRILDRLTYGDESALANLPKAKADQARSIRKGFKEARTPKDRRLVLLAAFVEAGQSAEMGRALGMATTLKGLTGSRQTFVVTGLDAAGNPEATRFTSAPVDPSQASPFPPVVTDLKGTIQGRGIALSWAPVTKPALPVMDYRVSRDGTPVTTGPFILGASWKGDAAQFVDREAGLEAEHTYEVHAVDIFGRKGPAATVRVFLPDPAALYAPGAFKAEAQAGRTLLTWARPASKYTTGFLIERAHLRQGPWEPLFPKPLSANALRHEDTAITSGTVYFYRIRSLNSKGELGEPSFVATAQAKAAERIPAPSGLAVQPGNTRVRLTWNAAPRTIAGFYVERRLGNDHAWGRLNTGLLGEPRYDDYLGSEAAGGFQYRVTAVDFDNTATASEPVSVVLEDRNPPPPPHLMQASGNFGKVQLRFRPAPPVERTTGYLVLRTQPGLRDELVIGDPLPAGATEFTDTWVQPGQTYLYRLMALAANGTRSEGSPQLEVVVGAPVVEAPPRPVATYAAKPFARVTFTFPAPPEHVVYFLHRKTGDRKDWLQIQGPLDGTEARDVNPPRSGKVLYRLHAQSVDGSANRSGEGIEVVIP